jgi:membrane protein DedA with SNARE-associated domain
MRSSTLGELLRVGTTLLEETAEKRIAAPARHMAATIAVCAASGLMAAASIGCATAALWIAVSDSYGAVWGALAAAGALLAIALAMLIALRLCRPRPAPKPAVKDVTPALLAEAEQWIRENPGTTIAAALVAGFLRGRRRD